MPEVTHPKKNKHFRSLTVTVTLAFLVLSILVLFISGGMHLFSSFKTQQQIIQHQQKMLTKDAAETVSVFVTEKFEILNQAADLNNLAESPDRRMLVMNKLLGRNPAYRQLFLVSATGTELQRASRFSGSVMDPLEIFKIPLLADTLAGKNYISPVYIDPETSAPLILLAVPTKNILRESKGAFVAEVNLKFMWDLVSSIQVGQEGQVYVVDKQGNLLAFSDISRVLARENVSLLTEVAEFKEGADETDVHVAVTGIQGTQVLSSYEELGVPDWAVVLELPVSEAYAPVWEQLLYSLLILVFSSALAVTTGIFLARRITKGIIILNEAAEEISKGNLDVRVAIPSNNEVGNLADAFNTMVATLQELYTGMDKKVKEQTAALSEQVAEGEKSRLAILNLLEDIEKEKEKVERVVVERTKELHNEKARLIASINSLSFGFIIADKDDNILLQNSALMRILELDKKPFSIHDIAGAFQIVQDAKGVVQFDPVASCRKCMIDREILEIKEARHKNRFLRIFCIPISPETTAGVKADVIGYVFLVEDITEAKIAERSRDEFFAVASHELRTPLTAIRGNADMILQMYAEKIIDKDMKEMLVDINTSSIRLIDIVNDFLEVSRIEQGKFEIHKEVFDVSETIEKVHRDMKDMIAHKGIYFTYITPPQPLPKVYSDKNRVEQILMNLVGNAEKFTKQGGITVEVEPLPGFLKIRVADTGVGISQENQDLLFRKFQQAGEQMLARDITQGTGLGLYISKMIVSSLGGSIGIEHSELGNGSIFAFTVPIAPPDTS